MLSILLSVRVNTLYTVIRICESIKSLPGKQRKQRYNHRLLIPTLFHSILNFICKYKHLNKM